MKKFLTTGSIIVILLLTLTGVTLAEEINSPVLRPGMQTHQEMYMILLSEKYTPELTKDWKAEFERRDTLREEFAKFRKDKEAMDLVLENLEEIKNRLKNLEEKMDMEKMQPGPGQPEFRKRPDFPQERFLRQRGQFIKNRGTQMGKNRELFQQFTQAIEAGDETQIKTILPLLFQQLKESNQIMEKQLETIKNSNDN